MESLSVERQDIRERTARGGRGREEDAVVIDAHTRAGSCGAGNVHTLSADRRRGRRDDRRLRGGCRSYSERACERLGQRLAGEVFRSRRDTNRVALAGNERRGGGKRQNVSVEVELAADGDARAVLETERIGQARAIHKRRERNEDHRAG